MNRFNIAPCPSDPLALTNRLVVHPGDFPPEVEFAVLRNKFIFSIMYVKPHPWGWVELIT